MLFSKHITGLTAVGLVAGAIAAPAGLARPITYEPLGPSASVAPKPALLVHAWQAKLRERVPRSAPLAAAPTAATIVHMSNPSGGFDWGDSAIGAGGGVALAILGIGGALAVSQRRARRPTAGGDSAPSVATS